MDQVSGNHIAICVKEGRIKKGYTQQELSDLTGISIRSVQRIENGEVIPRQYTLRLLAEQLDLALPREDQEAADAVIATQPISNVGSSNPGQLNKPRKIILSAATGLLLILGTSAFIAQSPRFPETTFEAFCLWSVITLVYTIILFRLWR
jgi:transcriptional regulator with XRE-family HTH domain